MPDNKLPIYEITPPTIPSAGIYFFTTTSGVKYEVRFGRRENNILHVTIVFGVLNEEFNGEEYTETNRGEVFRVMSTLIQVIRMFIDSHPKVSTYEFSSVGKQGELENGENARHNLYKRYLPIIFPFEELWVFEFDKNKTLVSKKKN